MTTDDEDLIPAEALEELRDDPQTEAFLHTIRHDGPDISIPGWISGLITSLSEQIIGASEAPNYLQMEATQ